MNCLKMNGREENEPVLLSQTFNFFEQLRKKKKSKLVDSSKNYADYITEPSENYFILILTNREKVQDITEILNIRKSIGPNSIPNKRFKKFSEEISLPPGAEEGIFNYGTKYNKKGI